MLDDGSFEWFDWETVAAVVVCSALLAWLVVRLADWQTRDMRKMF